MSDSSINKIANRRNRRLFLAVAVSAIILALLAGCPGRAPAPTPTPTRTPRSLGPPARPRRRRPRTASLVSTSTLQPPTPAETPTVSVPSTPSATPEPTATPTPPATPFPPGPRSKLGLFVSRNDPRIFDLLRTGNVAVVKTLEYDSNFVTEIKQVSPDTLVVARLTCRKST